MVAYTKDKEYMGCSNESSAMIRELYDDAIWIKQPCPEQRRIFRYWEQNNTDPVYQSLAWDVETTGVTYGVPTYLHLGKTDIRVHNPTVFGISAAIPYKDKIALFWARCTDSLYDDLLGLLNSPGCKVGHNIKYDIRTCRANGIELEGYTDCTFTMARIVWNRLKRFALQKLCEFMCPSISDWEEPVHKDMKRIRSSYTRNGYPKKYTNYSFIDDELMSVYSMTDSFVCQILNIWLRPKINKDYMEVYKRERLAYYNIITSELRGIPFDIQNAKKNANTIKRKIKKLIKTTKLHVNDPTFNPLSPKQVLESLHKYDVADEELINEKGNVSADAKVMGRLSENHKEKKVRKFAELILNIRSNEKIRGSYLIPLINRAKLNNCVIYFTINTADSRTGRMASKDPSIQNIPRPGSGSAGSNPVRSCFVVRPGYDNYFFDYEQMEMALFGFFAKDKHILEAYARGEDLHNYMTIRLFGDDAYDDDGGVNREKRQKTKGINFGIIYGMGIKRFASQQKLTISKATEFHEMYMDEFPSVHEAQILAKDILENYGYIEDPFGRRYHLHVGQAYKAVNAYIQGGCAQAVKVAYNNTVEWLERYERKTSVLALIHDEMWFERLRKLIESEPIFLSMVKTNMEEIPQLMKKGFRFRVDCKKTSTNWENKKKYEFPATI